MKRDEKILLRTMVSGKSNISYTMIYADILTGTQEATSQDACNVSAY